MKASAPVLVQSILIDFASVIDGWTGRVTSENSTGVPVIHRELGRICAHDDFTSQ